MSYTLDEHNQKKLFSGTDLSESATIIGKVNPNTIRDFSEAAKGKSGRRLIVQMEAIHEGLTANYTYYTEAGLKAGLNSWTHPYKKPVLTHHNSHNGETIGRILEAKFSESTISGRKGLIFTCEITDPDAIEKVLDGRYQTVSIGATTDKVTCNICGTDRTQDWCEHWRGEEYDGQKVHYIIGTTNGREVSYVNVPADENAGNFSIAIDDGGEDKEEGTNESATMQIFQVAEGLMQNVKLPSVNLYENATDDVRNMIDGLVSEKKGAPPVENPESNLKESELQTKLTEAQGQLETANGKIQTLESELNTTKATLGTLTVEKTRVDAMLVEKEQEVERLTTENADLLAAAHKALAEKVVDLKLGLRKSDVIGIDRDEAVEAHIKRTEESLNDAVTDLLAESKDTTAQRGMVPNPGAAGGDNNPNEKQGEENKKVSVDEAVGMFKNMFGSRKR